MSDREPLDTLNTGTSDLHSRRFEAAWLTWRAGDPTPRWQDYLPAAEEPCNSESIFLLVQVDIECRVKAGLSALLSERYFEHPRLQRDDARLDAAKQVELIRWEYQQRWLNGERARRGDYETAFPQHADALRQLKPNCACPRCQRTIALNETDLTLHCPHCDTDSPLPTVSPLLVASLVMSDSEAPGLDLRDYELCERLGIGGMGEVYRASDPALGRDLAIKVMKERYSEAPQAESRFLREARITGSLQHPGIVPIYNLGRLADGRLHYTMRLVRGRTLSDILNEEAGQIEHLPSLAAIFEKVCQAVAYAHSRRVIHRDLKPSNIMVGAFGEVQVMDWGLAKPLAMSARSTATDQPPEAGGGVESIDWGDTPSDLTRPGSGMGTPAYMPPEQALGEWDTVDERADVFALGAILCDILTGQPPYLGRDARAILEQAKRGDLSAALTRLEQSEADAALVQLCRECLAPEREGRPRHAGVLAQRMAGYQAEVQERLRRAEVDMARAEVAAREGRRRLRWVRAFVLVLLVGLAISSGLALWAWIAQGKASNNAALALRERDEKNQALGQALNDRDEKNKALQLAKTRLNQVEKSIEILVSTSRGLNPFEKEGPGLREQLSQKMIQAAARLRKESIADPLTLSKLQHQLGLSLIDLGEARQAIPPLEEAKRIRQEQLGGDNRSTLESMSDLAYAYLAAGQFAKAVQLYEETAKKAKAKLGFDHADTLGIIGNLAMAYQSAGQMEKVIPLLEPVLAAQKAKLGPDHEDTLISMSNLAAAYQATGQVDKAVSLLEETRKKMGGKFGLDHPFTLTVMHQLARAYQAKGQVDKAMPLYEQTLAKRKAKLGAENIDTLDTASNLASAYQAAGRAKEAVAILEQTLPKLRAKLGADHPSTLQTLLRLATAQQAAGKVDRAESLFREALALVQKKHGADSLDAANLLSQLSANLLLQKKYADAEPVLRQCLTIREKKMPDNWLTFNARSMLGDALLGQKRYTEAEPLLVQGYEGMKRHEAKIPPPSKRRLIDALDRLVRLYEARGQKAQADEWRTKRKQVEPRP